MATWKKVLVSGSNIDVANLTADGTVTFSDLNTNGHILSVNSSGVVGLTDPATLSGTDQSFKITGSDSTNTLFNANGDSLTFASNNGIITNVGDSSDVTTLTISTPQDLRSTASPGFNNLSISGSLIHAEDADTKLDFTDNTISFVAGNQPVLTLDGTGTGTDGVVTVGGTTKDVNFQVSSWGDANLLYIDARADLSSSGGVLADRGKVGIALGDGGVALLTSTPGYHANLVVSGSGYFTGNVTASKFSGDGSGLTNVAAATLDGFSVSTFNTFTGSIQGEVDSLNTFTGSIQTEVDALTALTSSYAEVDTDASKTDTVAFYNNTTRQLNSGSETFKVSYNSTHFATGGGPDNNLNNGSGSYYLYVESASIGDDLRVAGNVNVGGAVSSFQGFAFNEGVVTITSGSTVFGSGSTPAQVDIDGGHQFTGSIFITGGLYVDNLSEANSSNVVVWDSTSNRFHYTSSTSIATAGGTIGEAGDGDYTDGFFDTFTSDTPIGTAIDEISEAFSLLAPAQASALTSTNLTFTGDTLITGKLASGLNASDWNNVSAGTSITTGFDAASGLSFDTVEYRAGKYTDFITAGGLDGGVSSSITWGDNSPITSFRDYGSSASPNTGTQVISDPSNGSFAALLNLESLGQYNNIWVSAEAKIQTFVAANTGSYRFSISGDTAGTTNTMTRYYVGNVAAGTWPNATATINSIALASETYNYLSGIQYLKTATVTPTISSTNAYWPLYNDNNHTISSTYFASSITTGSSGTPAFNDSVSSLATNTTTIAANKNSGQSLGTALLTVTKPGKSNVTDSENISGTYKINSYTSTQDTNGATTTMNFLDEYYRIYDLQDAVDSFPSGSDLTTIPTVPQLVCHNGRLISGQGSGESIYSAMTQGSSGTAFANYIRKIPTALAIQNKFNGTLSITRGTNDWAGAGTYAIDKWDSDSVNNSGPSLQVAMILGTSGNAVTGTTTAGRIFDFGRSVFDDDTISSTPIIGIKTGGAETSNTSTETIVNWSLPTINNEAQATGTADVILWVRYKGSTNNYIDDITLTFS